jgi:hypothetical protein
MVALAVATSAARQRRVGRITKAKEGPAGSLEREAGMGIIDVLSSSMNNRCQSSIDLPRARLIRIAAILTRAASVSVPEDTTQQSSLDLLSSSNPLRIEQKAPMRRACDLRGVLALWCVAINHYIAKSDFTKCERLFLEI